MFQSKMNPKKKDRAIGMNWGLTSRNIVLHYAVQFLKIIVSYIFPTFIVIFGGRKGKSGTEYYIMDSGGSLLCYFRFIKSKALPFIFEIRIQFRILKSLHHKKNRYNMQIF